jgi:hypothetical protein
MPITFSCQCGKAFNVADDLAGKRTKCPACSTSLLVPAPVPAVKAAEGGDAPAAKPVKKVRPVVVVEEDEEEPDRPKKKRKKKKTKEGGIDRDEWEAEEEARAVRAFYTRRLIYIIGGSVTILAAGVCALLFAREKALGLYVILVCGAGVLGGLYCIWQGISGTFHKD